MSARSGWDVHTHLLPAAIAEMARAGRYGMALAGNTVQVHGFKLSLDTMGRPEALLARLDADGLEGGVVAIPPPLFRADLPDGAREDYVREANDGLLGTVAGQPRLRPMAYLPTDRPELAAAIAATLDARWAGVIVGTDIGEHSYADADYHPLWAALAERGLPVLLHPSESHDKRLIPFYLSNLLGNPLETTLAAAQLIFGDVPGLFPDLKVILSHGGGALAALIGRWQRGVDTARPGIGALTIAPRESVKWFYLDTIVHSEIQLRALIETVGEDHLLLGSDWPFPMGTPDADHDIGPLPAQLRQRIRIENPAAIFGARLRG